MKYYIVVGEASGDLHGSNLIKAIKDKDPQAEFRFFGGDLMEKEAATKPSVHYSKISFMGFFEIIKNLRTLFKHLKICKKDIKNYNPDILILIDFPGFNFKILKYAKKVLGLKRVYYYISPQLWAWKAGRIKTIKKFVDRLFVILPFEEKWYRDRGFFNVHYVGNPLLDAFTNNESPSKEAFIKENKLKNKPIISLLPGSRKQEIKKILPQMLSVIEEFKNYQFVIAKAKSIDITFYYKFVSGYDVSFVDNKTYDLLKISDAALVKSGTSTLETAIIGTPQIVCYKSSNISYQIAKRLIKHIKYISLVNLIMDKEVVKELIQGNLNKKFIVEELKKILFSTKRDEIISDYKLLREKLKYNASKNVVDIIWQDS